jgi:hypothetical protein
MLINSRFSPFPLPRSVNNNPIITLLCWSNSPKPPSAASWSASSYTTAPSVTRRTALYSSCRTTADSSPTCSCLPPTKRRPICLPNATSSFTLRPSPLESSSQPFPSCWLLWQKCSSPERTHSENSCGDTCSHCTITSWRRRSLAAR